MRFAGPLVTGTLVQRYKRFLADVRLDDGSLVTASCPNTGAMLGLTAPGSRVYLSTSDSPTRKYRHTWEMLDVVVEGQQARVGINTGHPNSLVAEAIREARTCELAGYDRLRTEVKYGKSSRIDILLESDDRPPCYVEIKNVHLLRRRGLAEFPDCVTARGTKHLAELSAMVGQGARAAMVYLVQRDDADAFSLAGDLDPNYLGAYAAARAAGVEAYAYGCRLTDNEIVLERALPII